MRRGHWYAVAVLGLVVTGVVAWQTWRGTSQMQVDPVAAVIGFIGLAVSIAALRLAVRAQKEAHTDVAAVARRLEVAVKQAESEARRQLLGDHDRSIDVQFSFRKATAHNAAVPSKTGTLEEVVNYYRKLRPRRMVITGKAGSGKTVLAIELILGLLSGRAEDAPVPVRMSAAQLDTSLPPSTAVIDWLVGHLTQTYGLPRTAARQVVRARMVLPVIDGLDEMDALEAPGYASRAGQAIRACNAYVDGSHKAAIVLTCRIGQYEALEQAREWVHDAAQVQLRPVEPPAARRFLTRRVTDKGRWQPVLDAMRLSRDGPLASALSTPWRLTLAAAVYEWRDPVTGRYLRDPADLISPGFDTEAKIRDHLLGLFIPAAVTVRGCRYSPASVHRWLGVLAGYLDANTPSETRPARLVAKRTLSGTDLVLHQLWPLAGPRWPRAITGGLMAVIWLGAAWWNLTRMPISFVPWQVGFAAVGIIAAIVTVINAWTAWPRPNLINLRQLRSSQGRRLLMGALAVGLVAGLAFGFGFGLGFGFGFGFGLVAGLVAALGAVLLVAVLLGPGDYSVTQPGEIIRADLLAGVGSGMLVGFVVVLVVALGAAFAVALVLHPGEYLVFKPGEYLVMKPWDIIRGDLLAGLGAWLVTGLAGGLAGGLAFGLLGWRYITLLLCTRRWSNRWLPWRLGSFLQWCYDAGLVRAAGIGYQFRHRELQDYLAKPDRNA